MLAATSLWGASGPAQALAHVSASPAAIGAARLLLGGLVLGLIALRARDGVRAWLCGREWPWLALAAVSTGVFQAAFFAAVNRTGAALATLVALGAAPVATGLAAHHARGEPLGRGWAVATAAAITGCGLLVLPGAHAAVDPPGIALALVAAACYAGYTVSAKRLLEDEQRPVEGVIAASVLGGALVLAPALTGGAPGLLTGRGIALVAFLGLASTAAAYVLFVRGLRSVPAATAGTLSLAEPLVAVALGVLVIGERLTPVEMGGAVLLLGGIAIAALSSNPSPARSASLAEGVT